MLAAATPMFLLIPDKSNQKVLHPGTVLKADLQTFEAEFEEPIAPALNSNVNAFGEVRGKFFQQGARVTEIRQTGGKPIFAFARVGEPVSAEQRQTYRVSAVSTGIVVRVDREDRCPVLDVSPEGFGAIVGARLEIGAMVNVLLRFWSEDIATSVRVQTLHMRPDGKFRCGLLAPDQLSPARKALQKISMTLQRAQLTRLSGAA